MNFKFYFIFYYLGLSLRLTASYPSNLIIVTFQLSKMSEAASAASVSSAVSVSSAFSQVVSLNPVAKNFLSAAKSATETAYSKLVNCTNPDDFAVDFSNFYALTFGCLTFKEQFFEYCLPKHNLSKKNAVRKAADLTINDPFGNMPFELRNGSAYKHLRDSFMTSYSGSASEKAAAISDIMLDKDNFYIALEQTCKGISDILNNGKSTEQITSEEKALIEGATTLPLCYFCKNGICDLRPVSKQRHDPSKNTEVAEKKAAKKLLSKSSKDSTA